MTEPGSFAAGLPARFRRPRYRLIAKLWLVALGVTGLLGFAFQGSRGIWEPDEGFYSNVAAGMESSGDFRVPRLNGEPFLDKPPLNYWGIAAGLRLVGYGEWGARTFQAVWFIATAFLAGLLAASMWGPGRGPQAMVAYASMLAPFLAANVLTPDTPLTFCAAAAGLATWRWSLATSPRGKALAAAAWGCALGLGILAKGPAMLIFAFPMGLYLLASKGLFGLFGLDAFLAAGVAALVGGGWYAYMVVSTPGAAEYFFDNQVSGRLWSGHYNRNAGTLGALRVYLPALFFGTLPWSLGWLRRWIPRLATRWREWRQRLRHLGQELRSRRRAEIVERYRRPLFLGLTVALPILVLAIAQSRLPLYVLPIFPLLAVAAAARRWRPRPLPSTLWIAGLIALKLALAQYPAADDNRRFAEALAGIGAPPGTAIVAIEKQYNGLPVYGYSDLLWLRLWENDYPFFSPPATLGEVTGELAERQVRQVFIVETKLLDEVEAHVRGRLGGCTRRPGPFDRSFLDCDPADESGG